MAQENPPLPRAYFHFGVAYFGTCVSVNISIIFTQSSRFFSQRFNEEIFFFLRVVFLQLTALI